MTSRQKVEHLQVDRLTICQLADFPAALTFGAKSASVSGLGNHLLADYQNCRSIPDQVDDLQRIMIQAAEVVGATIVSNSFHQFNPHGLSGVVVIAESHLAVHTWPEHRVACVDLFTCSDQMNAAPGLRLLFQQFGCELVHISNMIRSADHVPR